MQMQLGDRVYAYRKLPFVGTIKTVGIYMKPAKDGHWVMTQDNAAYLFEEVHKINLTNLLAKVRFID